MELRSLSMEEGSEGLSPKLVLMLVSLRLGYDKAGSASVGKTVSWVQPLLWEGTVCTAVVLPGCGGWTGAGDRQEGVSSLLLPRPAASLLSPLLMEPNTEQTTKQKCVSSPSSPSTTEQSTAGSGAERQQFNWCTDSKPLGCSAKSQGL